MTVAASRGVRGAAYTVLTPANRYASRLPEPPRRAASSSSSRRAWRPSRFGQYVVGARGRRRR